MHKVKVKKREPEQCKVFCQLTQQPLPSSLLCDTTTTIPLSSSCPPLLVMIWKERLSTKKCCCLLLQVMCFISDMKKPFWLERLPRRYLFCSAWTGLPADLSQRNSARKHFHLCISPGWGQPLHPKRATSLANCRRWQTAKETSPTQGWTAVATVLQPKRGPLLTHEPGTGGRSPLKIKTQPSA